MKHDADAGAARVERRPYGRLADGREVHEYTLAAGGLTLCAIEFGGIVTALRVPDRRGRMDNIVLGLPTLHDYESRNPHLGTIVGRYANRIAGGRFMLDAHTAELNRNEGANTLHGGTRGFGQRWWDIEANPPAGDGSVSITLRRTSNDGEEGFPGTMAVEVVYTLGPGPQWRIDYRATCDRPTVVNLSHHDYFNLRGHGDAMDHRLWLPASRYCPVDEGLIPLGIAPVAGTPFDFRDTTRIGERIRQPHEQLLRARGYDHNWVLDADRPAQADGLRLSARLEDPHSGRTMDVLSTEPGVQFYSGNFLDGSLTGSAGQTLRQGDGLCLETQHFPDSPNRPASEFPSTRLEPGQTFRSRTVHRFGCLPESTSN
nr:aldose epimerase family protein [Variovorax dokdonensis]